MKPDNIILECVVGSQLYNLDTPESDIDIKGIFIADPKDFWTLNPPKEVRDHTDPDWAYYELKKFCSLALKMNPTIIELLWTDNYLTLTPLGQELKDLRKEFLHQGALNSYLGYAVQQVKKNIEMLQILLSIGLVNTFVILGDFVNNMRNWQHRKPNSKTN